MYRDVINKSRRRGEVPLHTLFDNISLEDRLLYMIDQTKETVTKEYKGSTIKVDQYVPFIKDYKIKVKNQREKELFE